MRFVDTAKRRDKRLAKETLEQTIAHLRQSPGLFGLLTPEQLKKCRDFDWTNVPEVCGTPTAVIKEGKS